MAMRQQQQEQQQQQHVEAASSFNHHHHHHHRCHRVQQSSAPAAARSPSVTALLLPPVLFKDCPKHEAAFAQEDDDWAHIEYRASNDTTTTTTTSSSSPGFATPERSSISATPFSPQSWGRGLKRKAIHHYRAALGGDGASASHSASHSTSTTDAMDPPSDEYGDDWQQAGAHADAQDLAGPGAHGRLDCTVSRPQKENEGTQNQFISYLVTSDTDFKSFQSSHSTVRRRFTDFVFLQKTLAREYPQCAVPPLPDKHKMEYVRGDRFGPDFTQRRAYSLQRFLKRLTLHPVLRRATLLTLFLESSDWNATMKSRPSRGMSASEPASSSVLETWTDSFLNAFSKPHKADRRFLEVRERADKLDDDLGTVAKSVNRLARRESDLEADYADLAAQFQKLAQLEPGVQNELTGFAGSIETTGQSWKTMREYTDQDYLGSLRDMEAYINSVKALLKTREQKQLDFEGLTEYLTKAVSERDTLASGPSMGASGFIRAKIEDVRGVDHETARRERVRKLEVQIRRLQDEVEGAKKMSEAFDEEVVKEVADFERIKAVEFRDSLGGLADANCDFFRGTIETWEKFITEMERDGKSAG
ncbi:hypothetical protein MBLNU459_g4864t2 [Dothideomycetes sp. NU459]